MTTKNLKVTPTIVLATLFFVLGFLPDQAAGSHCRRDVPCVDSNDIIDGQVSTPDIGDNAVSTPKLQDNAVTGAKVLDGSLTGADIQDGSVGSGEIAEGAVGSAQINSTQVQRRVSESCTEGKSIVEIKVDGTVVCEAALPPPDISARVHRTGIGPQSIPNATETVIVFNSERWDTDNIWDPGNPTKLTAQTPGKYLIYAHVYFQNNSVGDREVFIRLNGALALAFDIRPAATSIGPTAISIATHYDLAAGDTVDLRVIQDSGGPLDVVPFGASEPDFGMVKLP